ncbi:radical SAM protein [Paenibacillus sp. FSL L8-0502]|uniref:B12-binding domain-containing radical SAM protein n=1 Tax=Paenibacillus sp. FSL L8-0502 TaxID=2954619 RepID=UPI003158FDD3
MKSKKDENQLEILLINPPLWYYQSVPPDITAAAALLHHQGVGTKIRDLNLESFHYFFRGRSDIITHLTDAELFYNFEHLEETCQKIAEIYDRISEQISPAVLRWNLYDPGVDLRNIDEVLRIAEQKEHNPYFDFFKEILPDLVPEGVKVVAISIFHPDQVIPLFSLTSLLKEYNSNLHIHLFGNLEDQINTKILVRNLPDKEYHLLFSHVDSFGLGNEHYRLSELVRAVEDSSKLEELSWLLTQNELQPYIEETNKHYYTNKITLPVLSSLPASALMPEEVLNVAASVSCYWKGCTYCSIKEHGTYQKESIESILQLMENFSKQQTFSVLRFRDCCISPTDLEKIATQIVERKLILSWACRARLEKGFNSRLFELLNRAGCIMISFGVETFETRVSRLMNKGIDLEYAPVLIKSCYEAGIAVKLTAMIGFPGETSEEALANQARLRELFPYCIDIRYNRFILFENSPIAADPAMYSIQKIPFNNRQHLRFYSEFSRESGMTQVQADIQAAEFEQEIKQTYAFFLSEEHLLLYLKKWGLSFCMNLVNARSLYQ